MQHGNVSNLKVIDDRSIQLRAEKSKSTYFILYRWIGGTQQVLIE
jgi:hypothetical protein